ELPEQDRCVRKTTGVRNRRVLSSAKLDSNLDRQVRPCPPWDRGQGRPHLARRHKDLQTPRDRVVESNAETNRHRPSGNVNRANLYPDIRLPDGSAAHIWSVRREVDGRVEGERLVSNRRELRTDDVWDARHRPKHNQHAEDAHGERDPCEDSEPPALPSRAATRRPDDGPGSRGGSPQPHSPPTRLLLHDEDRNIVHHMTCACSFVASRARAARS